MFANCFSLSSIPNISCWKAFGNINFIFENCKSLTSLPDFSKCYIGQAMNIFMDCISLSYIPNYPNWETIKFPENSSYFNCFSLINIPKNISPKQL